MNTGQLANLELLAEELDEECAKELSAAFLEDAETEFVAIEESIKTKNAGSLKAHVHALKGCSRSIKAEQFENLSANLESMAIDENWDGILAIQVQYKENFDALCAYLRNYLSM